MHAEGRGLLRQVTTTSLYRRSLDSLSIQNQEMMAPGSLQARLNNITYRRKFVPLPWTNFFNTYEDFYLSGNTFRIYKAGETGPVLFLLHGGGCSALSWALFAASITKMIKCQVVAIDIRGHGETRTSDEEALSIDTLIRDTSDLIKAMYGEEPPRIVLVGHSMGGAIAIHLAGQNLIPSLIALVVIDVVEGTAMDSLKIMQSFLRGRPSGFKSIEHAVEWSHTSGQLRNLQSARVSMPGQIKNSRTGQLAITDIPVPMCQSCESICDCGFQFDDSEGKYEWRIDLRKTEPYWSGWFQGISTIYLSAPVPKLLILAGVDRLDKTLTVAHMQGKFQTHIFPQSGHCVHEDLPDKVAEVISTFLTRHKFTEAVSTFRRVFQPFC